MMKKWFCTGFDDGDSWVQFGLDELGSCGPYGEKVLAEFEKQQQKRKIRFDFKESESSKMLVRPIRGWTKITIQGGSWKKRNAPTKTAISLIAHEIVHIGQPSFTALSVLGELEAYEFQYQIHKELGNIPSKNLTEIHELVEDTNYLHEITSQDLGKGRELIKKQCSACGYGLIPRWPGLVFGKREPAMLPVSK